MMGGLDEIEVGMDDLMGEDVFHIFAQEGEGAFDGRKCGGVFCHEWLPQTLPDVPRGTTADGSHVDTMFFTPNIKIGEMPFANTQFVQFDRQLLCALSVISIACLD